VSQKGRSRRLRPDKPVARARSEALAVSVMTVWKMARETGLEPATSGVTGRRSNQLSYSRAGRLL
jgi:hypothetical protein